MALLPITVATSQEPARWPDDPLFRHQASFLAAGDHERIVNSRLNRRDSVTVATGAALNLPRAWAYTTGSRDVLVAVLDDGFFYAHEDVAPNVWRNPGETGVDPAGRRKETNGVDDDKNGFVDDVVGWDFVFGDPDPDPYVYDGRDRTRIAPYWHSISALGIIGAKGNNGIGVAGINWDVSMMLLKIGAQGTAPGEVDTLRARRAAQAIRFAADHGARVINWSGFVTDRRPTAVEELRQAIVYAASRNALVVAGAGNDAQNNDIDNGACVYPQCFDEPNLIRVAQLAADGSLYRYTVNGQQRGSNYGVHRVELAAMGEHVSTSLRHAFSTYEVSNGTSSTGPVVTGVAALVLAVRPELSAMELRNLLMETGTELPSLRGVTVSGRSVNVVAALERACAKGCRRQE